MMTLSQRIAVLVFATFMSLGSLRAAETLNSPPESLNGLRPGTLTVGQLTDKYGKPPVSQNGGLLELYGGPENSRLYGWFLIDNPQYTIPDLAVETAKDSDRVDLVMSIGFEGLKTEKSIGCFDVVNDVTKAYGKPDFAFAVPMNGVMLHELYYLKQGLSFDIAPVGPSGDRQVIAIYVTYPEYMQKAVDLRKQYIDQGVGANVTDRYQSGMVA